MGKNKSVEIAEPSFGFAYHLGFDRRWNCLLRRRLLE
jgi:hypothetical protein